MERKKRIIIVGAGVGGLCAGIFAQKNGFQAILFEKHSSPGGECTAWNRKGNLIDGCIHWLTGTKEGTSFHQLWKTLGVLENTILHQPQSFFRLDSQGKSVTLWRNIEKFQAELLNVAPEDKEEIFRFIGYIKSGMEMRMPLDKPIDKMNPLELLKLQLSLGKTLKTIKDTNKISCGDYAKRFQSPILKKLMSSYISADFSLALWIMSLATFMSGSGDVPVGGSLEIIQKLVNKYLSYRGELKTSSEVQEVIIEKDRAMGVKLKNNEIITGDYVILACDTDISYHHLLKGKYNDKAFEKKYINRKKYPTQSCCLASFAVDADLTNYDENIIFDCEPYQMAQKTYHTLTIRAYPYRKNTSGKTSIVAFQTQYYEDYLYWKQLNLNSKEAYRKEKEEYAQTILQRLEEKFPELKGKIEPLDVTTPVTYESYCGAYCGSFLSFPQTPKAKMSLHKGTIKGIRNCFLTGQWLQSPGGVPIAAMTGKFVIQRICDLEKQKFLKQQCS